ncbi:UNVERIFIED_CONTAM: hypothetical protein NCL1_39863 [Trichonephila clavipes]
MHQLTVLTQFSAELKLWSSSHRVGLWPYSGSQVLFGSTAMRKPTKKSSREPSVYHTFKEKFENALSVTPSPSSRDQQRAGIKVLYDWPELKLFFIPVI